MDIVNLIIGIVLSMAVVSIVVFFLKPEKKVRRKRKVRRVKKKTRGKRVKRNKRR